MDERSGPAASPQLALQALATEHSNLQMGRMGTIAEANGRSALYLSTLSSAAIAIAFIGQASTLGDPFYLFALTLLPVVFLLGFFTYFRLVQNSMEDAVYAMASLRIREYFVKLDPDAVTYFPPSDQAGIERLRRIGFMPGNPYLQVFLTAASMVLGVNSIVGGVIVALGLRSLFNVSVPLAAGVGGAVALGFATLLLVHQARRFRRFARELPGFYPWEGSGAVEWAESIDRTRSSRDIS